VSRVRSGAAFLHFVCKELAVLKLLIFSTALFTQMDDAPSASPAPSRAEFSAWFEAARHGRLAIPDDVCQGASRYRYVFVNGLDIGLTQGCFTQNLKQLRARGVPRSAIHLIDPSAKKTVAENLGAMRREMMEIADRGPEPLVVIAHSRGACDALAFALTNPEFVTDRVRAIFLIQGPFGGSSAADFASGEGNRIDRQMPPAYRLGARVMGQLESKLLDRDKQAVIASLSHSASERFWERLIEKHRDSLAVVGPKVFYVTSQTRPSHHPVLQRITAWYVDTYYGPNDGLIALEDQIVPGVGTVLAVLEAGHTDLTHRFPSARPKKKLRQALVDAIVMSVGTPDPGAAPDSEDLVPTSYQQPRRSASRRGSSPRP
jgi:pimeloyl-ACP methyl ester carboxylesterase